MSKKPKEKDDAGDTAVLEADEGSPEALAATPPPHPMAVSLVLKQATRNYIASGGAIAIVLNPITDFAATTAKSIGGTVTRQAPGIPMPGSVTVTVFKAGTPETTVACAVAASTGVFTGTIAANALTVGAKTASASSTTPAGSSASVSFNVT